MAFRLHEFGDARGIASGGLGVGRRHAGMAGVHKLVRARCWRR